MRIINLLLLVKIHLGLHKICKCKDIGKRCALHALFILVHNPRMVLNVVLEMHLEIVPDVIIQYFVSKFQSFQNAMAAIQKKCFYFESKHCKLKMHLQIVPYVIVRYFVSKF